VPAGPSGKGEWWIGPVVHANEAAPGTGDQECRSLINLFFVRVLITS
jgi:hypothetical protein